MHKFSIKPINEFEINEIIIGSRRRENMYKDRVILMVVMG